MKIFEVKLSPNQFREDTFDMTVFVDEIQHINTEVICEIDGDMFWYGETKDGFVEFGITKDIPTMGHEPGYMWSSRASVFNYVADKMCKDVRIRGPKYSIGGAMTIPAILNCLTDKYEIAAYKDEENEDISYHICLRGTAVEYNRYDGKLIDTYVPTHSYNILLNEEAN